MSDMGYCGGMGNVQDKVGPVASGWNCYRIFFVRWSGVLARCLQYVWCTWNETENVNPVDAGTA